MWICGSSRFFRQDIEWRIWQQRNQLPTPTESKQNIQRQLTWKKIEKEEFETINRLFPCKEILLQSKKIRENTKQHKK